MSAVLPLATTAVSALANGAQLVVKGARTRSSRRPKRSARRAANRPIRPARRRKAPVKGKTAQLRNYPGGTRGLGPLGMSSSSRYVSDPVARGAVGSSNGFAIAGMPNAVADYDRSHGLKVRGTTYVTDVRTDAAYLSGSKNGGLTTLGPEYATLRARPAIFGTSNRLGIMSQIFSAYVYRRLKLRYTPACATSTAGQVLIGMIEDSDLFASNATYIAPIEFREAQVNAFTAAWQECSVDYQNIEGARTFFNDATDTTDDSIQITLMCCVNAGSINTTYGTLEMDYEIDFYNLRPPSGTPMLSISDGSYGRWAEREARLREKRLSDLRELERPPPLRIPSPTPSLSEDHFSDVKESSVEKGKLGGVGRGTRNVSELSRLVSAPLAIPKKEKGST